MTTLWTNFATTGNPTPDDSLGFIWEPVTDGNLHYLALNPRPTMEADIRQEVRRFHSSLPTLVNLALHPQVVTHHSPAWEDSHTAPGDTDDAREEL
nr:bile salt-activated lipase-like [Cherax quadricarinatus]